MNSDNMTTLGELAASAAAGDVLVRVDTHRQCMALTFDDGPNPPHTRAVLRLLASNGAKATFFMLGSAAQGNPELVQEVVRSGHAVGNHSYSHRRFPCLSEEEQILELKRAADMLGVPHGSKLFRPPFGSFNRAACQTVRREGYVPVGWDVDSGDWGPFGASDILTAIRSGRQRGSIVLLHDSSYRCPDRNRYSTLAALDLLLRELRGQVEFLTVPDLLSSGTPVWGLRRVSNSQRPASGGHIRPPRPPHELPDAIVVNLLSECGDLTKSVQPSLTILTGDSGSGKSALADALCSQLPLVRIQNDKLRVAVLAAPSLSGEEDERFFWAVDRAVVLLLREGFSVLWDARFPSKEVRQEKHRMIKGEGYGFQCLYVNAPEDVRRRRLELRAEVRRQRCDSSY
ncbi:MAG: polysaccharide deacetylase family protein, partial [Verrucomicrobia bacterium]|nr:polysaccharide deacetylase family protein [Verrucomicrobiota bacterium]